jgi:hypothetical protein
MAFFPALIANCVYNAAKLAFNWLTAIFFKQLSLNTLQWRLPKLQPPPTIIPPPPFVPTISASPIQKNLPFTIMANCARPHPNIIYSRLHFLMYYTRNCVIITPHFKIRNAIIIKGAIL